MGLHPNKKRKSEGVYRMKLLFPPIRKCKRMYKLLLDFYTENENNKHINDYTKFNHAVTIFCAFYNVPRPKRIRFRRTFGKDKCVGLCYASGNIDLLYPYNYNYIGSSWVGVVYHELFHYIFHCQEEEKALEFELKMLRRR